MHTGVPAGRGPGTLSHDNRETTGGFLMIEARGLVKHYGSATAVNNLSFDVRPGTVTGFLGPNGAGKSTTMRMILGLDRPDAGTARVNGKNYHDLRWPLREVGALLEAKARPTTASPGWPSASLPSASSACSL
jgi:ABC-2 type transport system ATP-binding protein